MKSVNKGGRPCLYERKMRKSLLYYPDYLIKAVKRAAKRDKVSYSQWVRQAIQFRLDSKA